MECHWRGKAKHWFVQWVFPIALTRIAQFHVKEVQQVGYHTPVLAYRSVLHLANDLLSNIYLDFGEALYIYKIYIRKEHFETLVL